MPPATRLTSRLLLSLAVALLALLIAEGALSLLAGRSLRELLRVNTLAGNTANSEAAPAPAATGVLSEYRLDPDPRVGYTLRDTTLAPLPHELFHTDRLGMRLRPGDTPPEAAQRIVVLGDSVAFGMGLTDDQTLAAQLEALLAESRGPQAPPLACFTVAGPGWNHRNAVHFLLDHFAEYDPDIVVYMPTSNDLADTYQVDELGRSRVGFDVAADDPLLAVNWESLHYFQHDLAARVQAGEAQRCAPGEVGPFAMMADIAPESRRRYDRNVDSIALLAQTLQRNRRQLLLLHSAEDGSGSGYVWFLRERLLDRQLDVPEVPGPLSLLPEFTLGENPHPNAECTRAMALWVAADLLARGWVSAGEGRPLPDAGGAYTDHRAPPRTDADVREQARDFRERDLAALQPVIDFRTGRGYAQVYGGLNPDATLGARLLAMLRPDGPRLTVALAPLSADTALYPLTVTVLVNGTTVGTLTIPPGDGSAVTQAGFDLPSRADPAAPIEVLLVPEQWTVREFRNRSIVASTRLVSIECAAR